MTGYANLLPVTGADLGTWGNMINAFLLVAHNSDGTLNNSPWLVYSAGTPAANGLTFSRALAVGTDSVGNSYLAGITMYGQSGSTYTALNLSSAGITFQYASSQAGPWTVDTTISDSGSKLLLLSTPEDWKLSFGLNLVTLDSVSGNPTDLFLNHGGNLRTMKPGNPGTVEGWHSASLLNGWKDNASGEKLAYRLVSSPPNSVQMFGDLQPGNNANGTLIATLPSGYHPASVKWWTCQSDQTATEAPGMQMDASGNISVYGVGGATRFAFNVTVPLDF